MTDLKPLVLDVDGTFLKTDLLFECFWRGLGTAPFATLRASARHLNHPARLKHALAEIAPPRADLLPVRVDVAEKAARPWCGRRRGCAGLGLGPQPCHGAGCRT